MKLEFCYGNRPRSVQNINQDGYADASFEAGKGYLFYELEFPELNDAMMGEIEHIIRRFRDNDKYYTTLEENDENLYFDNLRGQFDNFMCRFVYDDGSKKYVYVTDDPDTGVETTERLENREYKRRFSINMGHVDIRRVIGAILFDYSEMVSKLTITMCDKQWKLPNDQLNEAGEKIEWVYTNIETAREYQQRYLIIKAQEVRTTFLEQITLSGNFIIPFSEERKQSKLHCNITPAMVYIKVKTDSFRVRTEAGDWADTDIKYTMRSIPFKWETVVLTDDLYASVLLNYGRIDIQNINNGRILTDLYEGTFYTYYGPNAKPFTTGMGIGEPLFGGVCTNYGFRIKNNKVFGLELNHMSYHFYEGNQEYGMFMDSSDGFKLICVPPTNQYYDYNGGNFFVGLWPFALRQSTNEDPTRGAHIEPGLLRSMQLIDATNPEPNLEEYLVPFTNLDMDHAKDFERNFVQRIVRSLMAEGEAYYPLRYRDENNNLRCRLLPSSVVGRAIDICEMKTQDARIILGLEDNIEDPVEKAYFDFFGMNPKDPGVIVIQWEGNVLEIECWSKGQQMMLSYYDPKRNYKVQHVLLEQFLSVGSDEDEELAGLKNDLDFVASELSDLDFQSKNTVEVVYNWLYDTSRGLNGELLGTILKRIHKNGYMDINRLKNNNSLIMDEKAAEYERVKNILYPKGIMVEDPDVVEIVCDAIESYRQTGIMPNVVIMGAPGCGKTALIKNLARCMMGDDAQIEYKSSADLKGAYVGWTSKRVFNMVKEVAEFNRFDTKKVIFIDEAYNLQDDEFGKEAVEILLPLMSGDRKVMEMPESDKNDRKQDVIYDFEENHTKVPPIWLAGYENEMRKMLSSNAGLYRRVVKISLKTPTVSQLFTELCNSARREMENTENPSCVDYFSAFQDNEKQIKAYFAWATVPDYAEFFANYAGVLDFFASCVLRLPKSDEANYYQVIDKIIESKKAEIRKQYKAVLTEKSIRFRIETEIETNFDDIAGVTATGEELPAKQSMREILAMICHSKEYKRMGITPPKGALLVGPPGTGKTLYAQALAGELQSFLKQQKPDFKISFIPTISTELTDPKKIEALFRMTDDYDVSVIFIDEIDSIGRNRHAVGAHPELLIQLMKELDGFETRKNVFVLAATNDPAILDPALKRPGRFDRIVKVENMDISGRKNVLEMYISKLGSEIVEDSDEASEGGEYSINRIVEEIARETPGYSPSALRNLVNESAILNRRCFDEPERESLMLHRSYVGEEALAHKNRCFLEDIKETMERISLGEVNSTKREAEFNIKENNGKASSTAIHEVGHALIAILNGEKPFEKITVVPRGNYLGYVRPNLDEKVMTKRQFLNSIRCSLGGRVAEELFYGEDISVGASQDIQDATWRAKNMVSLFGMSDEIGPMALMESNRSYIDGYSEKYTCSEAFREKLDQEVLRIIKEQLEETRRLLLPRKQLIEELSRAVFEHETMSGEEFMELYKRLSEV